MNDNLASDGYLIVGLGNPGRLHRGNRHNVGFMVADLLAGDMKRDFSRLERKSLIAKGELESKTIVLAKPQTFMNACGSAVAQLLRLYAVPHANLLVISDDIDLPLGQLRLKPFGGTGGHRGLRSIQQKLDAQDFPRLRIGIGRPPGRTDPADFVLDDFSAAELSELEIEVRRAADCVHMYLSTGIQAAMTTFNRLGE